MYRWETLDVQMGDAGYIDASLNFIRQYLSVNIIACFGVKEAMITIKTLLLFLRIFMHSDYSPCQLDPCFTKEVLAES